MAQPASIRMLVVARAINRALSLLLIFIFMAELPVMWALLSLIGMLRFP